MSVDASQERLILDGEIAVAVRLAGVDGGVVSVEWVVSEACEDCADSFGTASMALTLYAYSVDGLNPVS